MNFKKTIFITLLLIIPLALSACSFAFGPGGGSTVSGARGVFKTGNQGDSWLEQNTLVDNETSLSRFNATKLAFDIFDSSILYRATDVGLFMSHTGGDSWTQIHDSSINDFVLNPKTRGIIYLASGNSVFKTTDNGQSWQLLYAEAKKDVQVVSLAVSYRDTSQVYLLASDGTLLSSLDWGDSWQAIYDFDDNQTHTILIDPANSNYIYVASNSKLYRSADSAASWQELISPHLNDFPGINSYRGLHFASNPDNLIYLSKYGILISSDHGTTWQPITLITAPNSVDIHALAFDPNNQSTIFYAVGNILYHTVDAGHNWKTKVLPIPGGARASQLLIDPANPAILYLGITQ